MLPSFPGYVSVHDLLDLFKGGTGTLTVHQDQASILEPEYVDKGPFVYTSIQIVPGVPISNEYVQGENGLIKRIKLAKQAVRILQS